MFIDDLDLKGCTEGIVYADFRIKRKLSIGGTIRNTYRYTQKLGVIGCDSTCATCDGPLGTNCLTCTTPKRFTNQTTTTDHTCVDNCVNPYYILNKNDT
jgi:hypothetical protein